MCLLLLTLPPATQSQLSLNPWHFNHPVHLVFVFCFFPLYLEILLMTSDYALGFYALFAPFLLPRESLDLEHVISLWSYSICFLTSWAWVCACQTFTVFKVIPVGLLILAFTGLPQLALWQFPIVSRHERRPSFPVTAFGKSNITLPTNSQDLCSMQFSTVFKWALSQLGLLVTSIPSHQLSILLPYCIFLHCIYYITYLFNMLSASFCWDMNIINPGLFLFFFFSLIGLSVWKSTWFIVRHSINI